MLKSRARNRNFIRRRRDQEAPHISGCVAHLKTKVVHEKAADLEAIRVVSVIVRLYNEEDLQDMCWRKLPALPRPRHSAPWQIHSDFVG
jgi:hypothetical protein